MIFLLFRNCCRILWKQLSYQQQIIWLFLVILINQQQSSFGKATKWNHSIQRRFMWKQMDSTVDGFVDRVVTGARVMKSMIGDFMPPKPGHSGNVMDYLPTETTRIRYIIRNPHTKETKVIRVRPSKKVVKLMAMTPKPLMTEKLKPMHMNDPEMNTDKLKVMHMKDPEYMRDKLNSMYIMEPEKLRQMEKEQELIAEGRLPIKNEAKPSYTSFRSEKYRDPKYDDTNSQTNDEIVSGKIKEFNDSWRPVYKVGDPPAGFTTSKPYMMSVLHTSAMGELLPEPQKQVYEPLTSNEFPEEDPKKSHTYEVTEYTAEESVVQPYTHDHHNRQITSSRGSSVKYNTSLDSIVQPYSHHHHQSSSSKESTVKPIAEVESIAQPYTHDHYNQLITSSREASTKHNSLTTENSNIITQIEDDTDIKPYNVAYRSHREFLPSRSSYKLNEEIFTTTTARPSTTTTTEEPNYPAVFLKKLRNRPDSNYNPRVQHQINKSPELSLESSWVPSNVSYSSQKSRQIPYHQHLSSSLRTKSQKWPPDVADTYLNIKQSQSTYDTSTTTEAPTIEDFTTPSIHNISSSRKNVRLKSQHYPTFAESKTRSVRQRGSVKYGDKLDIER